MGRYVSQNVYINKQLTPHFKKLIWLTKTKAKSTNWKFVWFKNYKVLEKKSEGDCTIEIQLVTDIDIMS